MVGVLGIRTRALRCKAQMKPLSNRGLPTSPTRWKKFYKNYAIQSHQLFDLKTSFLNILCKILTRDGRYLTFVMRLKMFDPEMQR